MTRIIEFDPKAFRRCFNSRPFRLRHYLRDDVFSLERLAELAASLPTESVEYNAGNVPIELDPSRTPGNGLSPHETVRRIAECQSWIVLKNAEQVPEYREILNLCVGEIRRLCGMRLSGIHLAEAFIFVSSPNSVTPFHIDPEHNFLFQLRGRKQIHVFSPDNREIVSCEDLERFFSGAHRNLSFRRRWQPSAQTFELRAGDGVHVPIAAPHWVQNGSEVSVSFSVTFRSRASKRQADVWQLNHRLRRMGLHPSPAGTSLARDVLKQVIIRGVRFWSRVCAWVARTLSVRVSDDASHCADRKPG